MISINTTSLHSAYVDALRALLFDTRTYDDPEIYREDSAVIRIHDRVEKLPLVELVGNSIQDSFDYPSYFPHITKDLVDREMVYWNDQFFGANKLTDLIAYLKEFPLSKRGVILFWEDKYRDLSKSAVCEVAAFFRLKSNVLEMHSHMRANNASFLLFMDMRILMGVQRIVAEQLGAQVGDYVHFIDSFHVYEHEKEIALRQLLLAEKTLK